MKITLDVKKVTVLLYGSSGDQVSMELDGPTPFPAMGDPAYAVVQTKRGYGVEWCKAVLGVEPEIIDARPKTPPTPFSK